MRASEPVERLRVEVAAEQVGGDADARRRIVVPRRRRLTRPERTRARTSRSIRLLPTLIPWRRSSAWTRGEP